MLTPQSPDRIFSIRDFTENLRTVGIQGTSMRRKDRLLAKARNNPNSLRFREFETLLAQCGWTFDHQSGSHRIWYSPQAIGSRFNPKGQKQKGIR